MILPRITQFAGESFSTRDNVRTVYAGQEDDTIQRSSRTIVLVGPIGAGKSSLIDFLCNYFYGVRFDSPHRYKIADECFDNTTPDKAVTKYIFNGTSMPFRPIVIDTPGIGDPTGLKANRELASVVTDYFNVATKERIHAVGLVLPSFMHSVNDQIDSDIKLTLSLFPDWMHANIVPIVTYSSQATATNLDLLRHFGLDSNATFCVDTNVVFSSPEADPEERGRQHALWQLTSDGVRQFLKFVGDSRPQTIEKRLLPGDATPNSPLSPNVDTLQPATSPPWTTTKSEDVTLVRPEQTGDLTALWPLPSHSHQVPLQEIDEVTSIREVTVITERVPSQHVSPTHSLGRVSTQGSPKAGKPDLVKQGEELGQGFAGSLGQERPGILSQRSPISQGLEQRSTDILGQRSPISQGLGQNLGPKPTKIPSQQSSLGQQRPTEILGQGRNSGILGQHLETEHQGIPLSPGSAFTPTVPLHKSPSSGEEVKMRSGQQHRSDSHLYPYVDEEMNEETSNLELLRRYIYDPATRTYKIQYVHEVSTRESRRSSGRQSLRASATDIHQPQRQHGDRSHAPGAGLDDSFLGTLADELRRQGQYGDDRNGYRLTRNTSAPHLDTEYDKENARRIEKALDYSPDTLKRLLDGIGQQPTGGSLERPAFGQRTTTTHTHGQQRPTVVRKPYNSAPIQQPQHHYSSQIGHPQQPIRVPVAPLRPINQNIEDEYADQALRQARAQRSASHVHDLHTPVSPSDKSFDDKERMFERSQTARQSIRNSKGRGGVRHAIATRPDTDFQDDWDESETGPESRRSSTGGRGPGLGPVPTTIPQSQQPYKQAGPVPQPRIISSQPLRHTPSGLNDGQRVRPTDLPKPETQFGSRTTTTQWKASYPGGRPQPTGPVDLESGSFRPNEDQRPLRSQPTKKGSKKSTKNGEEPKNRRKFPSFTKCCFYVCAPFLVIIVVAAVIITLIIIA